MTDDEIDALLPRYLRFIGFTDRRAADLTEEGLPVDVIERRLFGDLPNLRIGTVWRYASEPNAPIGLVATASGQLEGSRRGEEAALRTFARVKSEADRFARAQMAQLLRHAGWDDAEIEHDN